MRVSTAVMWLGFCVVGVSQRRIGRAIVAGMTWLLGFEVAWQIARFWPPHSWSLLIFAAFIGVVVLLQRKAVRPSLPLLALALAVMAVWLATGFHINNRTDLAHFNSFGEACNEGAKTLWGLAYLVPLLMADGPLRRSVVSRRRRLPAAG
jgi:hypothetical protein